MPVTTGTGSRIDMPFDEMFRAVPSMVGASSIRSPSLLIRSSAGQRCHPGADIHHVSGGIEIMV